MTMTKKRTALINNLIMGTTFFVLSAVLFLFSLNYPDSTELMDFSDSDKVVFSVVPENKYVPIDKATLFSAADYEKIPLYYAEHSEKWHISKECQYIRNSKNVKFTDYHTAISFGLSACSACGYPDELPD